MRRLRSAAAAVAVLSTAGCAGAEPEPIAYDGHESCAYCRMAITDARYGAELITGKGKVHKFDSAECLASYYARAATGGGAPPRAWVSDFRRPGTLIPADSARFVRGGGGPSSPMGLNLKAFEASADTAALRREFGGEVMSWRAVLELVGRGDRPDAPLTPAGTGAR